jgi:hypothetical protein
MSECVVSYVQTFDKPVVVKPRRVMHPTIYLPSDLAWKFYELAQEIDRTIIHEMIWGKGSAKKMEGIYERA